MSDKPLPPIWLMGLTNAPLGVVGAIALLTLPQLLAARHLPEPQIAQITGLALAPGFVSFLVAPILDVWLSRRTYAIGLTLLGAVASFLALVSLDNLPALGALLFVAMSAVLLANSACGGWLGSLVPKAGEDQLGAWLIVGNVGGFGLTAMVAIGLLRGLPTPLGAAVLAAMVATPIAVLLSIPAVAPDGRLARESFGQFLRDLTALVRQPQVLLSLLMFAVPAASFALTNTLGGLGRDYGASERFVSMVGGFGVTAAGLLGSLLVPLAAKRLPARPLYLAIGTLGSLFTLALILMPKTPTTFLAAMIGENVCQAAAFATVNVVIFQGLGKDNPFASTQYALLWAASGLPLSYMQVLDGQAYGRGGLTATYLTDGGLGLLACASVASVLWIAARRRGLRVQPAV